MFKKTTVTLRSSSSIVIGKIPQPGDVYDYYNPATISFEVLSINGDVATAELSYSEFTELVNILRVLREDRF